MKIQKDKPTQFITKHSQCQFKGIPNDKKHRAAIALLLPYLVTPEYGVRLRGRGCRKKHGSGSSISLTYAETFAIYIDKHDLPTLQEATTERLLGKKR